MKLATLILTISVTTLCAAHAEDASLQSLQLTQASHSKSERQSSGACTPIGLTARNYQLFGVGFGLTAASNPIVTKLILGRAF